MGKFKQSELIGQNVIALYQDRDEHQRVKKKLLYEISVSGHGSIETRLIRRDGFFFDCMIEACFLDSSRPSKGMIFFRKWIFPKLKHSR